jgi:hypothetical protein
MAALAWAMASCRLMIDSAVPLPAQPGAAPAITRLKATILRPHCGVAIGDSLLSLC